MDLEKRQDETQFDYHKRLIYGKLVDKTLADVDYTELAELAYGQPYSSDVARRMCYGSKRTLELLDSQRISNIDDCSLLSELEAKKVELEKERRRFYDQRREYNKLVTEDGRREHIYESLTQAANKLSETIGNIYDDAPIINLYGDNEAVLVFSDWHYGMVTSNVFNTYNTDICIERVKSVVDAAIERICLHHCRRLHVIVLGDTFHGAVHVSARVASEELVCDQIMQVSEILAQSIRKLSRYVEETIVYMTYGNHARTVQNKKDNLHRDNMERLIPWWLEQRFNDCDDIIITPDSGYEFIFANVCGHEICASHGDIDTLKTSPRLLSTLFQKKFGKDIEYILLGDKHHRESFDELGISAMLCGSLCGTDDHANDKRLFSSPSQLMLIVNEKCGVDAEYRISC